MCAPALVVLAAGMGSRYGGLKQVEPVGPSGELIIDYSVFDALRGGFGSIVFIIRREIEADFRASVGKRFEGVTDVHYVFQELTALPAGQSLPAGRTKPWGTGHAILMARDAVQTPFAAINADDFYGRNAFAVLGRFLRDEGTAPDVYGMVGFQLANTLSEHGSVARGICTVDRLGKLASVEEVVGIEKCEPGPHQARENGSERVFSGSERVSMNMWGFHPSVFAHLEEQFAAFLRRHGTEPRSEFYIPTVVNTLIESGAADVRVLQTDSPWYGVTYREDKPCVVDAIGKLVAQGCYPNPLWS